MQLEADIRIESTNNEAHAYTLLLGSRVWGAFYHTFHPSVLGANEQDDRVNFAVSSQNRLMRGSPLPISRHTPSTLPNITTRLQAR